MACRKPKKKVRPLWRMRDRIRDIRGQGTIEYAIVIAGFLALIVALGALWRFLESASLVEHAVQGASHHVSGASLGGILDVLLY